METDIRGMVDKLGGTKLIMSVLSLLVGVVAVAIQGDIPSGLNELLKYVLSAYVAGNVANTVVGAVADAKVATVEAKTAAAELAVSTAAIAPPSDEALTAVLQRLDAVLEATAVTQQGVSAIVARLTPRN